MLYPLLRIIRSRKQKAIRNRRPESGYRPQLEALEDRVVPSNNGTVHLTDSTATIVEETHYAAKIDVYAYGNGLVDGFYDVEVVAPGGKSGKKTDDILGLSNPNDPVQVVNGHFVLGFPTGPVTPATVTGPQGNAFNVWDEVFQTGVNGGTPGAQGYDDTTNPGDEYQVVLAQHIAGETQDNFAQFTGNNKVTKSKNFKVESSPQPTAVVTSFALTPGAVAGATAQDSATVAVTNSSGDIVNQGSVDFQFFGPNGLINETVVAISSSGTATDSYMAEALAPGAYYFLATYNGNSQFASSTGVAEAFTIAKANPSITTSQQPATAIVGSSIADQATVSGGYSPTGTVTFNLYNNPNGTGTPLFTDANEPLVNGVATSTGYTATATGTDYWVATYNGDGNNNAISSGTASEPVTITPKASPSITTSVISVGRSFITDQATVSGGSNPTGTVTFNLYNNPNGTGTPLFTDTETLSGGTATANFNSLTPGTVYYVIATYNGDSNNNPETAAAEFARTTGGGAS
jgi:hypothetical protein